MATGKGQTLESLYIELGLDISQLQAGILAADRSLTENLGRINRQRNIIKLRVEADIAGLDRFKDSTQILEIQERGLNQQLTLAKDKLSILEAAYQQVANNQNSSAIAVQNAEKAWQNARLEVGKLEQALKSLAAQKVSIDTTQLQENISKLNAKIQHVKINAEIDTSKLKDAGNVFEAQKVHVAALTKELDLQRQKLVELQNALKQSTKIGGADSVQSLNIKSNVLQQIQEINRLETRLKDLQNTRIDLQFKADSIRRVEAEVQENISRINAKIEHIKVKTDIDVSRLGSAASEFDRAKIHVQGLSRELDLQNQKLAELRKALSASISTNGLNNVKTINISTDVQRQIHEIDQLKAKIKELNNIPPPKSNNLLSGYLNIKGDVVGKLNEISSAFSQLKGATASADSAITASLGVIGTIPHPVGRAVAAFAALPIVLRGVENSLIDMTRAAAASGDAVYVMSRGFQMSIKDTGKFSTNAKVAGTDVNSLATAIKQVQRSIVKGGDDSKAAEWLKRYGESARDANGNLKNLNEMTFALSRALHKAQEEGKGAEFIFSVFRSVSADDITAIEDWIAVNEQAATIVKNGLANPKLAHEVKGNLNALAVQEGQLKASFENALLPVANEIIPRVTERMGKLTQILADNKDVIKEIGSDLASIWSGIETVADKIGAGIGAVGSVFKDVYMAQTNARNQLVERYKNDPTVKTAEDLFKKELSRSYLPTERAAIENSPYRYDLELRKYEQAQKKIDDTRRKDFVKANQNLLDKYKSDTSIKSATDLLNKLTAAEKEALDKTPSVFETLTQKADALYQSLSDLQKQAKGTKQSLDDLNRSSQVEGLRGLKGDTSPDLSADARKDYEAERKKYRDLSDELYKATHNDLDNRKFELDKWHGEMVNGVENTARESETIEKIYAAKSAQIEQERADKLQEIRDSIAVADKTALRQKLDAIEKDRQAWMKAGMDEAEATELAEKRRLKAIQEASEKAQQYIRDAADIEYSLTHTAFEKQLRDIERWEEAQLKKAETAEEIAGIIRNAAAKEAEAFENAVDRIKGKLQSLDDKIFDIDHSQYERDLRRIQQEYIRTATDLQKENMFNAETKAKLDYLYRRQKQELDRRADESRRNDGDYTKLPEGARQGYGNGIMVIGGGQIIDDGLLKSQRQEIGLLTDENRIRAQLSQNLPQNVKEIIAEINSRNRLNVAQQDLLKSTRQAAQSFQIIEGGKVIDTSTQNDFQVIDNDNVAAGLQELGDKLHQTDQLKNLQDSAQGAAEAQKSLTESLNNFPPDYFQKLADGTKSLSEMQFSLTESTMKLIDAQSKLADAFANLPTVNPQRETNLPKNDLMKLNYSTQDLQEAQKSLADTARETDSNLRRISDIPRGQPTREDSGFKLGFDTDWAKDVLLTGVGLAATAASTGVGIALSPEILAGSIIAAIGTGLAKGSIDATYAAPESDERLQPFSGMDLSGIITPLNSIDGNLQSVLTALQAQSQVTTPMTFETVITPLNNIEGLVQQVLNALANRQPPQVTVSPNISNNLGGAYVFDNAMKKSLVDDITSQIVSEITSAVRQATSQSNYSYGA